VTGERDRERSAAGGGGQRPSDAAGAFQALGGESVYAGRIVEMRVERFRHRDGEEVTREVLRSPGAVGIVAHDAEQLLLVRQPREAVGEARLLELPAGRLDVDGEAPLQAARRELAEEVGLGARDWEPILTYYSSAGFTDEKVHLFHASGLYEQSAESEEIERIEIVRWPLGDLDGAIAECRDAKTLIGLFWLARRLNG
jgi:8-oxo-dGTP pyrophosphatase MutT (NUDIX family)